MSWISWILNSVQFHAFVLEISSTTTRDHERHERPQETTRDHERAGQAFGKVCTGARRRGRNQDQSLRTKASSAFGQVVLSSPTNCAYGMSFHEFYMFFQFAVSFFETFKSCFFKLSDASVMVQGLSTSVCVGHKVDLRRGAKQWFPVGLHHSYVKECTSCALMYSFDKS